MSKLQRISIFILIVLISCKKNEPDLAFSKEHIKMHQEDEKISKAFKDFDKYLNKLYTESEKKPKEVLIKIDSLFKANEIEKDKYKSQIKDNLAYDLRYFKAELLYKIGDYESSIKELKIGTNGNDANGLVCNYVKLKKYDNAKRILDSIPDYDLNAFIYANFYETIGQKKEALKKYRTIQKDKKINNCIYYKLAVDRINELEKENPILLNNVYFQTGRPDFEICDSDTKNRSKVMELVSELPEVKDKFKNNAGIGILEAPNDNGKNYYWVRFYEDNSIIFKTEYNFFIYQKTFEIKYYDKKNKKILSLEEWRNSK